jgi:3-phenylpropionate/cinnamic acid dioxygenase small subunit
MSDQTEIANLLFEYAARIDAGDFEGVAELFRHGRILTEFGELVGYEAVLEMYRSSTRLYPDGTPRTRHITTNLAIRIEGDRAHCDSTFTVMQALEDFPLQAIICGRYQDVLVRDAGNWRFEQRRMLPDLLGDLSRHLLFDLTQVDQ